MATRTIKNESQKDRTIILTPFVPCSAKLPIISFFSSYFFKENSGIIALSFYFLSIIIIILSSILLKKLIKNSEENTYISELPEYRIPKIRQIIKDSFERVLEFAKRAGSIILISSVVMWFLISFSFKFEYDVEMENSILANIGRTFSWLFIPIVGHNSWELAVSAVQGLIAKEQVISSMSIIAGLNSENIGSNIFAHESPFAFLTPVKSYAFVCFNLFSAPCFAAISAMKDTFANKKMFLKAIIYQTMVAYIVSSLICLIDKN